MQALREHPRGLKPHISSPPAPVAAEAASPFQLHGVAPPALSGAEGSGATASPALLAQALAPAGRRLFTAPILLALVILLAPAAQAVEIAGQVINGTTGRPVPDQFVNLLALRDQMVPVRETRSDAEGRYRFVIAANPSERFLVQVPFRGVNYNEMAALSGGERITADVTVFETGAAPGDVSVEAETIFLDPRRNHVRVSHFYGLQNRSRPPHTYHPEQGSFRFALPDPVGDLQVTASRATGVPLRQSPQPTGRPNEFAIQFPLYPGQTEVQLSYAVPVQGTEFTLTLPVQVPTPKRHLAVPRQGVELESAALAEIEQQRVPQARVYAVETAVPGELALSLRVDPEILERAAAAAPSPAEAPPAQSQVSIVPHPVNRARWYILGLTLLVLLLGLYYLAGLQPSSQAADDFAGKGRHR